MASPRSLRLACALAVLIVAARSSAHDFWLEPSTFRPRVGESFTIGLRVGEDFRGDSVPRRPQRMEAFVVREGSQERPVGGFDNQDPAGYVRTERPGLAIIGYRSKANPHELSPEKFDQFLREEGLETIRTLRAERGESRKAGREHFYRFAKTLVLTGGGDASGFDRAIGDRYELVPETDPHASGPLTVRVLYDGKPLAGALVTAMEQDNATLRQSARTDRRGRVVFDLQRGVWLVKSVHMIVAPAGAKADWDSLWASLTFER